MSMRSIWKMLHLLNNNDPDELTRAELLDAAVAGGRVAGVGHCRPMPVGVEAMRTSDRLMMNILWKFGISKYF